MAGSGVNIPILEYGECRAFVFRLPCGSVLLVMSRLTVLTPISALQFECGWASDDRQ